MRNFEKLDGMTILITGGLGFIGSHLTEKCVEYGAKTIVFDNLSNGRLNNIKNVQNKCEIIIGDVRNTKDIEKVKHADVVLHEAATALIPSIENPKLDLDVNARGTLNILEYARKKEAKVIYASSGSVYGNPVSQILDETHPLEPISPYGISKLAAEKYCMYYHREYSLFVTCLRYFNVYGPRQTVSEEMGVIPIFVERIFGDKPPIIFGDGSQTRDFTHVSDVVDANFLSIFEKNANGKIMNIGTNKEISILDLASYIIKILNKELKPIFSRPKPGDIKELKSDISLAKKLIKYEPKITLVEGLKDYINSYTTDKNRDIL